MGFLNGPNFADNQFRRTGFSKHFPKEICRLLRNLFSFVSGGQFEFNVLESDLHEKRK